MSRLLLTLSVLGLVACGPTGWRNVDASRTRADFNWDSYHCRLDNQTWDSHLRRAEDPVYPDIVVDEERAAECMKARGWRRD
jgi:hypothetical protein